jgi:hypothetical protein
VHHPLLSMFAVAFIIGGSAVATSIAYLVVELRLKAHGKSMPVLWEARYIGFVFGLAFAYFVCIVVAIA